MEDHRLDPEPEKDIKEKSENFVRSVDQLILSCPSQYPGFDHCTVVMFGDMVKGIWKSFVLFLQFLCMTLFQNQRLGA